MQVMWPSPPPGFVAVLLASCPPHAYCGQDKHQCQQRRPDLRLGLEDIDHCLDEGDEGKEPQESDEGIQL